MSQARTTSKARIDIDGRELTLAPGQDLVRLMHDIEEASRTEGTFVHFTSGNMLMSALVSGRTRVVISVEADAADPPHDLSDHARTDWDF